MWRKGIVVMVFCRLLVSGADMESWLPVGFRSFCEWDSGRGVFVGMMVVKGETHIVEVDGATGKRRIVCGVPRMNGWIGNGSAFLKKRGIFACLGIENGKHVLCLLPVNGKGAARTVKMEVPVTVIEAVDEMGAVVGFGRVGKEYWLVAVDVENMGVEKVMPLPGLTRMSGGAYWHPGLRKLMVLGVVDDRLSLLLVDISEKRFEVKDGVDVGLDAFVVGKEVMFTSGIQACTAVAGIDRDTGVGFLTHVSHRNTGIETVLDNMTGEFKSRANVEAIPKTGIVLVGGVRGQEESEGNLRQAFARLTGEYGVDGAGMRRFCTSTSWNVVIYQGNVLVF